MSIYATENPTKFFFLIRMAVAFFCVVRHEIFFIFVKSKAEIQPREFLLIF